MRSHFKHVLLLLLLGLTLLFTSALPTYAAETQVDCPERVSEIQKGEATVWAYIRCTKGVIPVWRAVLTLVDFIVVAGLIVAAFANILNLKIDTYGVKQILPGLIIGIVLANLSFFIMHFFIEVSTIITQYLGSIVSGYTGSTVGDSHVAGYLLLEVYEKLKQSLFAFPPDWVRFGFDVGAVGAGGAVVWMAFSAGNIATGFILVAIFILIFLLLPLIMMLILLFLLYIRSYVLILVFMLSPIAFFALGFPPLRKLWQIWWDTFWKWLLMAPVSLSIVGFAVLFLHYANTPDASGGRNVFDFLFVNGIALGLLFLANRIPFMWGTVFGKINVMRNWAKAGSQGVKGAYSGAKWVGDRSQTKYGGAVRDFHKKPETKDLLKPTTATGTTLETEARKFGLKKMTGESDTELQQRVGIAKKAEYDAKLAQAQGNARRRNFIRMPESFAGGIQERFKNWDADEQKAVKLNAAYGVGGGQVVRDRTDLGRFKEEMDAIDDEHELIERTKELRDKLKDYYMSQGVTDESQAKAQAAAKIRKFINKGDTGKMTLLNNDRDFLAIQEAGMKRSDIFESAAAATRFTRVVRLNDYKRPGLFEPRSKGDVLEGVLGEHPGVIAPYGTVAGTAEADKEAKAGTSPHHEIARAAGERALNKDEQEDVQTRRTTYLRAAGDIYQGSRQNLVEQLKQVGGAALQHEQVADAIFRNVQAQALNLDRSVLQGLSPEQIQALTPHIQGYSHSIKGLNNIADIVGADDATGVHAKYVKHIIEAGVQIDPEQFQREYQAAVQKLNNAAVTHDELNEVAEVFGKVAPRLKFDKNQSTTQIREQLMEHQKGVNGVIKLLNYENVRKMQQGGYNPNDPTSVQNLELNIQQAVRVERLKQNVLANAAKTRDDEVKNMLTQSPDADPINVTQNATVINTVKTDLKTVLEFHPDLREKFTALQDAQKDSLLTQKAAELLEHINKLATQEEGSALNAIYKEENHDELHDLLERKLREGFGN